MALIVLATSLVFFFLVVRHTKLKYQRDKLKKLIAINETEIKVLRRNFSDLPTGDAFKSNQHFFSQDIDLFGKQSFFQYLNRTALEEGQKELAEILLSNEIQSIEKKQELIRELAEKVEFRQEFSAIASLVETDEETPSLLNWFSTYKAFVPKVFRWLPAVFSGASALILSGFFLDLISWRQVLLWLFLGLGITGFYLKKISHLDKGVVRLQAIFEQYHQLLKLIEETKFSSSYGCERLQSIKENGMAFSKIIHRFSKQIDALEQRNNWLVGLAGNGFLLWDLYQCSQIETWISRHGDQVDTWFNVIRFMDAYNTLGNFAYNHPQYVFPKIVSEGKTIQAEQVVHPLIEPKKAVHNDYALAKDEFVIITGANMAGKSTFLRTVSLQILMANVGLPVCASACVYRPIKLITSMRTNDSLSNEASYFYAELSRLKFIVDQLKSDNYLIVLDEILKGTNSADKAAGSRKFLEKLIRCGASGLIATHDLSLCTIEKEYPQVQNHYFDAEIKQGELYFDYLLKQGVCQNMNASFLLKKMEIVD